MAIPGCPACPMCRGGGKSKAALPTASGFPMTRHPGTGAARERRVSGRELIESRTIQSTTGGLDLTVIALHTTLAKRGALIRPSLQKLPIGTPQCRLDSIEVGAARDELQRSDRSHFTNITSRGTENAVAYSSDDWNCTDRCRVDPLCLGAFLASLAQLGAAQD